MNKQKSLFHKMPNQADKRQYVRLNSVFPVQFTIVHLHDDLVGIDWLNGYTHNVSEGGMCLETTAINESVIQYFRKSNVLLELRLEIPPSQPPTKAIAEVSWFHKVPDQDPPHFLVGLKFRSIVAADLKRILRHAHWFQHLSKAAIAAAVILFMVLIMMSISNYKKDVHRDNMRYNFSSSEQTTTPIKN